ncbi:MAG: hydrogenase formation protein HypD [Spirochaetota bacterium]|nr:hydrogenase formation protein HypD [Spirochaetota bacterium]
MKYLDEFRDPQIAKKIITEIMKTATRKWVIMEVCGGQTHSIIRNGIDQLLDGKIELVHGPGCPVCVTPLEVIDRAIEIAGRPEVIFTSFGDMLRVPGSEKDLFTVKSEGGDVRIVYSPLEALKIAKENPDREVVFFAVGFETTAPGNAMAIYQAANEGLKNFYEIVSHVLVPPAIEAILSSPSNRVQGFLAAGHVCTVMGWKEYEPIANKYKVPIIPTGFEPIDILEGILLVVKQLEEGKHEVINQYLRSVKRDGNMQAQKIINEIFEISHRKWRGIGEIPSSGLRIRDTYKDFDAEIKFNVQGIIQMEPEICISGTILQGLKKPNDCPAFGKECTPSQPLGATMVSSEGACSAYFKYQRISFSE